MDLVDRARFDPPEVLPVPPSAVRHLFLEDPSDKIVARRCATRLRNRLRLNSVFSAVTGLTALVAAGPVGRLLEVDAAWVVRSLGLGLVVFATAVLFAATTPTAVLGCWSLLISLADLGWVAATLAITSLGWLSTRGAVVMGVLGLIVLDLAVAQLRARKRLGTALVAVAAPFDERPPVEIIDFSRSSAHAADDLWPVITDHTLYARLAPNLKAAEALSPEGPGFTRSCTDSAGWTWTETCTRWDAGRRFDVDVEIGEYPYPMDLVQGSWFVEPGPNQTSTVGMRFVIQPKPGFRGMLFVPTMHLVFIPILRRIARGWDKETERRCRQPRSHDASGRGT